MTKREPLLGADCAIDVDKLVESRLLVQANSGAGKSWAIRRLIEQTYGKAQQIVIDHDGEYHTLREKFDFVLAGQKGDCPADLKSATLLARRLLELNVSVIVDIYELGTQRAEFVKRFLESLVNAPRDLWHSALVILDEAHLYCPEVGSAVSTGAVKNLMALGRKRGFAGVLATQRIAKLSKDAAAECNNKLIGRSALDVDMKRAAAELGFTTREDTMSLRTLKPGQFYVFGPAFADEVKQIQVGGVQTTHLRAGQRATPPTPPRERVKKVLAQLADLPHEAEEEAKTVGDLRAQIKQLKSELTKTKAAQPKAETKIETKIVEKPAFKDRDLKRIEAIAVKMLEISERLAPGLETLTAGTASLRAQVTTLQTFVLNSGRTLKAPVVLPVKQPTKAPKGFTLTPAPAPVRSTSKSHGTYDDKPLPEGEAAVLRAAIQFVDGLIKKRVTTLTGYKRSTRDAYILRLRKKGLLSEDGDTIFATEEGIAAMPDVEPLPTGEALRDYWFAKLPKGERQVLEILANAWPNPVHKAEIDELTGFKRSTRDAYLLRLGAKELTNEVGSAAVKAADALFEDAS